MPTKVVAFRRVGLFGLHLQFSDGSCGVHDFATMVAEPGSMLKPLQDPASFACVFLEHGALTWPNGFDIAPEWLRRKMLDANELAGAA